MQSCSRYWPAANASYLPRSARSTPLRPRSRQRCLAHPKPPSTGADSHRDNTVAHGQGKPPPRRGGGCLAARSLLTPLLLTIGSWLVRGADAKWRCRCRRICVRCFSRGSCWCSVRWRVGKRTLCSWRPGRRCSSWRRRAWTWASWRLVRMTSVVARRPASHGPPHLTTTPTCRACCNCTYVRVLRVRRPRDVHRPHPQSAPAGAAAAYPRARSRVACVPPHRSSASALCSRCSLSHAAVAEAAQASDESFVRAVRTVHVLAASPVRTSRHTNLTQKQGERRWVNVRFDLRSGGDHVCAQAAGYTWPHMCEWEDLEAQAFQTAANQARTALTWDVQHALTGLLATVAARGAVGQAVMWVRLESDHLLRLAARLTNVNASSPTAPELPPPLLPVQPAPSSPWDAATTGEHPLAFVLQRAHVYPPPLCRTRGGVRRRAGGRRRRPPDGGDASANAATNGDGTAHATKRGPGSADGRNAAGGCCADGAAKRVGRGAGGSGTRGHRHRQDHTGETPTRDTRETRET